MISFLLVVVFVLLIAVAAVSPNPARLSTFELKRRKDKNDATIRLDSLRDTLFQDVLSVQRVLLAVALVAFVLLSVAQFGMLTGSLVGVIVALQYGVVARINGVRKYSQKLYDKYELVLLQFLHKHQSVMWWLRSVVPQSGERRIASKAELEDMLNHSYNVLSNEEKTRILSSLKFEAKIVRDVMTPRSVVDTILHHEVLGPLVLDGLHKTGHSRFPVIEGDLDHVVGILHLRDVLAVDSSKKHTARADTAMSKKVYYIREDHTLSQALSAFLRTHHHMFIVINEFHETVGIITLEDTLETLLGHRIIDEFDEHDDMRAVAKRKAAKLSSTSTEVTKQG